ncbi:hypothetical protein [Vibrio sagamiensis]|uniref:Uncharacterized protein n=1 Tax=Vibrio sagamiensis NBRC 104589 TaxID=1219064 RepID=A0A511QIY9_9VIBR|nr:hypothetical protein [Vibrio sagamiensis]GEM77295.1 hypothetical protein VSA01S_34070 [Vibrio sagamiensis NBRC 104589]
MITEMLRSEPLEFNKLISTLNCYCDILAITSDNLFANCSDAELNKFRSTGVLFQDYVFKLNETDLLWIAEAPDFEVFIDTEEA